MALSQLLVLQSNDENIVLPANRIWSTAVDSTVGVNVAGLLTARVTLSGKVNYYWV